MKFCHYANSCPFPKNPFLGSEWLVFANPDGEKPAVPQEGGQLEEFPQGILDLVPGRVGTPEELMKRQEHWVSLLGDYNQIQVHINYLVDLIKTLNDPALLKAAAYKERVKGQIQQAYKKMESIIGVLPNTENTLKDSIRNNIANQLGRDRKGVIQDANRLLSGLIRARKAELEKVGEALKADLTQRAQNLKEKWGKTPPPGYEDVKEGWIGYCDQIIKTFEEQNFADLDEGKKDSPLGNELLKGAQGWWDMLGSMEDTYEDFLKQKTGEFTVENVEEKYKQLKEKQEAILNPEMIKELHHNIDLVLARGAEVREQTEARIRAMESSSDAKKYKEDIATLKSSLLILDEKMKGVAEKKDIKVMAEEVFTSQETIAQFQVPNEEGHIDIPKGLEGQIAALKLMPVSSQGRRQLMRTMLESMKAIEQNIEKYPDFAKVTLPGALDQMRLFALGLDINIQKNTSRLMLMNPFATLKHVAESYASAVKSNVETNEKRAAGYWESRATKGMELFGNVPLLKDMAVFKSATELSIAGGVAAEHAEHHKISECEKNYENVPPDHLLHIAEAASDEWELQACLKVLAKHGRINWYAPWLFKALNKYQKTIKIPTDRHWHMRHLTESSEVMRQAFVYIYRDEDVYKSLRNNNLSSYESKMSEYNKQWGGIAAQPGALEKRAEEILALYEADHENGVHNSQANPIEFESIIRYAVEWGKMKMESRLRLLVRGIASGLLSFDRGINATDKNNNYPLYDYFETSTDLGEKPTYDDVRRWDAYAKDKVTWDYFVHRAGGVMENEAVNQRLIKTMTQGSHRLDHDDAAGIAGYLTMEITRDLLKQKTQGGYGMPVTGLKSLTTGNEFWLRMYAEEYSNRSPQKNRNEMIRFASQFMMLEGIMNERVFRGSLDYYRLKDGPDKEDPPRFPRAAYSKVFEVNTPNYNANAGTAEILSDVAQKILMLDLDQPPLLRMLLTNKIKTDLDAYQVCQELESSTGMFEGSVPKGIDELYAAMPKFFTYVVNRHAEKLDRMVENITDEHGKHSYEHQRKVQPDIKRVQGEALHRGLTGEEPEHHDHGDHGSDHHGDHPAEGHDSHGSAGTGGGGDDGSSSGSTPVGGGPSSSGSTHGH